MISQRISKIYLPILFLLLTFISVNQWSERPIGNTATTFALDFLILVLLFLQMKYQRIAFTEKGYIVVSLYLLWALFGIVRGMRVAENYWEYKNLVQNSFVLFVPLCVYAFSFPNLLRNILRAWYVFAILAYVLFFYWQVGISQFYLGPVFLALSFLPLLKKKLWIVIILFIGILLLTVNVYDARSQLVKAAFSFAVALGCLKVFRLKDFFLKTAYWILLVTPVVFLYLGISGKYNIFDEMWTDYEGVYTTTKVDDESGREKEVDLSSDTRTFIYTEVIASAIDNGYVLFGRTPARGNDTNFFWDIAYDLTATHLDFNIKHERSKNEVCFPNIFTWLGLVGMLLYIAIYVWAAYLGVYRSKNYYIKLTGLVVAFNFLYGWVENVTSFDILNFTYWTFISMCLSSRFRSMTDHEFKEWFNSLFGLKKSSTKWKIPVD